MEAQIHEHSLVYKANSVTNNRVIIKVMESIWDLQFDVAFKQWWGLDNNDWGMGLKIKELWFNSQQGVRFFSSNP